VSFDPRLSAVMNGREQCYLNTLLDQGGCGSCYAAASNLVVSVTLCNAAWTRGGSKPGAPSSYYQISQEWFGRAWQTIQGGDFCAGGNSNALNNWVRLFLQRRPLSSLGKAIGATNISTVAVTTCALNRSSLTGACCDPYTMQNGNTPVIPYFSPNYAVSMNTSLLAIPGQCLSYDTAAPYPIDATSMTVTSLGYYLANTSSVQSAVPYLLDKRSLYALKYHLYTIGPIYVSIASAPIDTYPSKYSRAGGNGYNGKTWYAYTGTYSTSTTDALTNLTTVNAAGADHAVAIIGWAQVPTLTGPGGSPTGNTVECFIIQNSWGLWADRGLFYVPTQNATSNSLTPGGISLGDTYGFPLSSLAATDGFNWWQSPTFRFYNSSLFSSVTGLPTSYRILGDDSDSSARSLQAEGSASQTVGDLRDCSGNGQFLELAGAHALAQLRADTGFSFSSLAVHSLHCQRISNGIRTVAGISAVHPVKLSRSFRVVSGDHTLGDGSAFYVDENGAPAVNPNLVTWTASSSYPVPAAGVSSHPLFSGLPITNGAAFLPNSPNYFNINGVQIDARAVTGGLIAVGTVLLAALIATALWFVRLMPRGAAREAEPSRPLGRPPSAFKGCLAQGGP
jgi:hypothetical protein